MLVFLDFEASSLGKKGFPIEVGWVFEDGTEESHLIRPAPGWEEWAASAEAVHGIPRERLEREGEPHESVARRMVEALSGHDLLASAPSWDGQWLSRLLRAAGIPRHALRLRDTEEARREAAGAALVEAGHDPAHSQGVLIAVLWEADRAGREAEPAHRAVADARRELGLWQGMADRVRAALARQD